MKKYFLLLAFGLLSISLIKAQSVVNGSNVSSMAHFDDDDEPAFVFDIGGTQITPRTTTSEISESTTTQSDTISESEYPKFPGGVQGLWRYIASIIKYPEICQENGVQGRAICQFDIDKNGSVVNVELIRTAGDSNLDAEAIRVVKAIPNFIPAMKDGQPIKIRMTIPINFRLI